MPDNSWVRSYSIQPVSYLRAAAVPLAQDLGEFAGDGGGLLATLSADCLNWAHSEWRTVGGARRQS